MLLRPPAKLRGRGVAQRKTNARQTFSKKQIEFMTQHGLPCHAKKLNAANIAAASITALKDECLSIDRIVRWNNSQLTKQKADALRALKLREAGAKSYEKRKKVWLQRECKRRKLKPGKKREVGLRQLLEDDDVRQVAKAKAAKAKAAKVARTKAAKAKSGSERSSSQPPGKNHQEGKDNSFYIKKKSIIRFEIKKKKIAPLE